MRGNLNLMKEVEREIVVREESSNWKPRRIRMKIVVIAEP
jgi:hypothetical protein